MQVLHPASSATLPADAGGRGQPPVHDAAILFEAELRSARGQFDDNTHRLSITLPHDANAVTVVAMIEGARRSDEGHQLTDRQRTLVGVGVARNRGPPS